MKKDKQTVWVIMHYEFMGLPTAPHVDSVQFHVASSLKKAEKYVRSSWVEAHSWWQVHPHVLDAEGEELSTEGDQVYYYSHRGSKLKSAPMKRAAKAFRKHTARYPEFYCSAPPTNV
jgi:hypothetical protein